jgi:hypothetical protein
VIATTLPVRLSSHLADILISHRATGHGGLLLQERARPGGRPGSGVAQRAGCRAAVQPGDGEGGQDGFEGRGGGPWQRDGWCKPGPATASCTGRTCDAVALACLGVAAARPAPLVLYLALILLLAIPGDLAVAHRLASRAGSATE